MKDAEYQVALKEAENHLIGCDPRMAALIRTKGPCTLTAPARFVPFASLYSSIIHQQLHGKAAKTILGRVDEKFGRGKTPKPEALAAARMPALRACGLSKAKALAIKDLAAKTLDGTIPTAARLKRMENEAVIALLTQVRGIGPWTVEMMLMFRMGRIDVLPVDDFGVRKGFSQVYGYAEMASKAELIEAGEPWRPYRSVAAWYFWRALEK